MRWLGYALMILAVAIPPAISAVLSARTTAKTKVAFLSNNPHEFWAIARKGCQRAEEDLNRMGYPVEVEFYMPANGTGTEQHRIIENLVLKGVRGIAISPVAADHQATVLNRIIPKDVYFLTQDSDFPAGKSKRFCFIGTNNIEAGKAVGELVKEACTEHFPNKDEQDTVKVMIYVGLLSVQNARERRQGVIAALGNLSDAEAAKRAEGPYPVKLGKYEVLDTRTDDVSQNKCLDNVKATIVKYKDVNCLVGLWAYNPPAMLQGVKQAKRNVMNPQDGPPILLVGFDENEETLQGIKDGDVYATVVQNPYEFGYQSVRILEHLHRTGGQLPPPAPFVRQVGDNLFVKHRIIKRLDKKKNGRLFDEEVEAFHQDLKAKKG